ncbi:MerR family transcriptional regulator [Rhodocyclus tenuis]|uniref:Excisionase family DNA binding protein n=1 Tax=Rhodocyclus tenuis TaxID=1066 RepID=A0A840GL46_RHOTE|nr:helix-turn-helix domain-containing protein [Rhodocyclus tenuis]MBB4249152.1 excisionase family DNA binding protein [Rhodocyclus tenuis]
MPSKKPPAIAPDSPVEAYCTTAEAARLLGVGVTSIQRYVDQGVLQAWKTHGRHRRIGMSSVEALLGKRAHGGDRLSILVSDPVSKTRSALVNALNALALPLDVAASEKGLDSVVRLLRSNTDLWVLSPEFSDIDGIAIAMGAMDYPETRLMGIILCPSAPLHEDDQQMLASRGVIVLKKPYSVAQIQGIVTEMFARKAREAHAAKI